MEAGTLGAIAVKLPLPPGTLPTLWNAEARFRKDPNFGFEVPASIDGVPDLLLDPRRTWDDPAAYDRQAAKLVRMFAENFEQYLDAIDEDVRAAALG